MKKNFLCLMGGVLLSLPLLFASCGNGDNALEEIINGGGSGSGGGSSTINATAIDLDQKMKVLVKGGAALTITVKFTPTDATDKTVTWESKDPTIATVENGVVTPVGVGITTITAKSGELSATCEVFVGNEKALSSADYTAENYDILKGNMGAKQLTIPNDIKVVFNGVQTTEQIICSGDATIYLADGSENEVTAPTYKAGIKIGGTGTTLTINGETAGTGTLTANGGYMAAGIGTNMDETGGNIVINGGRVTATGGGYAAGIGTGRNGSGTLSGGNIVINGGTVTAKGGSDGAGIGTGRANAASITCGDITINGGTVTATGVDNGAGIGTGRSYGAGASNTCGAITIGTGVTMVTATKGSSAPNSIGKGVAETGGTQACGKIKFGTAEVFDGASPGTWDTMTDGNTYGGLKLAISGNDWTLTPAP